MDDGVSWTKGCANLTCRWFTWIVSMSFLIASAYPQTASWSVELQGGVPYNIPLPMIIRQDDQSPMRLTAHFRSEPFRSPHYAIWRMSRWQDGNAWEFEVIHHKLYLKNRPPDVQWFAISDGYNLIMINRAQHVKSQARHPPILRMGGGIVISHPESRIRNQVLSGTGGIFNWGYYLTGPVLHLALAKRFALGKRLFISTDIKANPSVSWVPLAVGSATVWNLPLSLTLGLGFGFGDVTE